MGLSLVAHCIYHYMLCVVCHGVNHGAGAYQRVARINTRENRVREELKFGGLLVQLFFRELK